MNDFIRWNKLTGIHWLKAPVDDLRIKIKLKPPNDIISLPKFEDYTNESSNLSLEVNVEDYAFKWQEKHFCKSEIQRYKDVHNCLTENELIYHDLIKSKEVLPCKVFSYIHEDYYMPLPQEKRKITSLSSCLGHLNLEDEIGRIGDVFGGNSASERHLFRSQEEVYEEEEQWTAMHIVFDNSDYNEDTLTVKQEATLLSIYHNTSQNYVIVTPDLNNLETNPYVVETNAGELLGCQYQVDLDFGETCSGDELVTLLTKLYKKWEKKHRQLVNFVKPPLGKVYYYITIEIISAKEFGMDDLYIEYDIKLPEGVECNDTLHGRTHVSEPNLIDDEDVWNFGHIITVEFSLESRNEPLHLNMYFEVISTDLWHRHRTEGYSHHRIPLSPGVRSQELCCIRPDEKTGAQERRFFVGGCHLFKNLEVLSKPELQNGTGDYTLTETGTVLLRTSVIAQSSLRKVPDAGVDPEPVYHETGTASALLMGAEAALRKYKKARARLAQASSKN